MTSVLDACLDATDEIWDDREADILATLKALKIDPEMDYDRHVTLISIWYGKELNHGSGRAHDDPTPADFRRSNGAPMVRSLDGKRWERYARPSGFGHDLDDESALDDLEDRPCYRGGRNDSIARSINRRAHRPEGRSAEGAP